MALAIEFTSPAQVETQNALQRLRITRPPKIASGSLAGLNAELTLDVKGEECTTFYFQNTNFVGTLEFTASVNGTDFFPIPAYPYTIACVGGTLPVSATPIISEALASGSTRCYTLPCGQLSSIRIRASAFTSGAGVATLHADGNDALNQAAVSKPASLTLTATAAVGVGATITMPAVPSFRHVIDFIEVTRTASAALIVGAGVTLVTTTNIPGTPTLPFGQDAAAQGTDKTFKRDFGGSGLACVATNTATTIVCPATTGAIWTACVSYRIGV